MEVTTTTFPPELCQGIPAVFLIVIFFIAGFFALVATAIKVWAFCKIFSKAGYNWALGLLMLVPIANIIVFLVLAFSDWPISKEMRKLKEQLNQPAT